MNKVIKYYLYILPFYSLIGIMLGVLRTAYQDSYAQAFLLVGAIFDTIIIISGFKYVFNKKIIFVLLLLIVSLFIGLYNNELSSRFVTDFTNPFYFFAKVYIFRRYWFTADFKKFSKYYTIMSFVGSVALLPLTYFLFKQQGATRLAIFPPMELPFVNFMLNNGLLLIASFIVIFFYGKRAQLVSALLTFFLYTFVIKRKHIFKYLGIMALGLVVVTYIFSAYSDNLAVKRLSTTLDFFNDNSNKQDLDQVSAGRFNEMEAITRTMDLKDYFIGKGFGFTYSQDLKSGIKEATNAHFSPIGFLSKYGLVFTIFMYYFVLSIFFKTKKELLKVNTYNIGLGVSLFIFFESFFAYAMFVVPIFPIALGVVLANQHMYKLEFLKRQQKRQLLST